MRLPCHHSWQQHGLPGANVEWSLLLRELGTAYAGRPLPICTKSKQLRGCQPAVLQVACLTCAKHSFGDKPRTVSNDGLLSGLHKLNLDHYNLVA